MDLNTLLFSLKAAFSRDLPPKFTLEEAMKAWRREYRYTVLFL